MKIPHVWGIRSLPSSSLGTQHSQGEFFIQKVLRKQPKNQVLLFGMGQGCSQYEANQGTHRSNLLRFLSHFFRLTP